MTVGLDGLLFLNNSIPKTNPAIRPYIGLNGDSILLFHVHPKKSPYRFTPQFVGLRCYVD